MAKLAKITWAILGIAACAAGAEPELSSESIVRFPPLEPDAALGSFEVAPGFRLELAASEPQVADPIAFAFDESGRLFVVEMRDYSERRDERLGRVRLLEDADGDGKFERSAVFAEGLAWPTAILCFDGGVFVGASPDIFYLKDTDGDGVADLRRVVFTGFGSTVDRLNVQQLLNSFQWGVDQRIHGACGGNGGRITSPANPQMAPVELRGRDFSFDPRTLELRGETGGGQYGLSFDDRGVKFVCSNSAHLQMLMYDLADAERNPFYGMPGALVNIAADGPAAEVFRISPDEPWRVIRTQWRLSGQVPGPIEGGGRASGYFTAATGIVIYRGDALGEECHGDVFVADCGSNLIHRKKLVQEGPGYVGRRPRELLDREFIASQDTWFRPVQLGNGPDGALYIADMYREIIEHPWSLPQPLKQHLDLNSGNDRGRIYRVTRSDFKSPRKVKLGEANTAELVKTLEHPNGWHRDTAARLLYERQNSATLPLLEEMLLTSGEGRGRMHALALLQALGKLNEGHLRAGLQDADAAVREQALKLCKTAFAKLGIKFQDFAAEWRRLATDADPRVRYQLALFFAAAKEADRLPILAGMVRREANDSWMRAAVLNAAHEGAGTLFTELLRDSSVTSAAQGREFLRELLKIVVAQNRTGELTEVLRGMGQMEDQTLLFALGEALVEGLRPRGGIESSPAEIRDQVQKLLEKAAATAWKSGESASMRANAVALLSAFPGDSKTGIGEREMLDLLNPSEPVEVQVAVVQAFGRARGKAAAETLLQRWVAYTPRVRSEVLQVLLGRREGVEALLGALESGALARSELDASQVQFLRAYSDQPMRRRALALFPQQYAGARDKLIEEFMPALKMPGNKERGLKIFRERCASCHRWGEEGHAVGPDLAATRASGKEKLLVGILDPNREVPPNYLGYVVETKDGESATGLIVQESATTVTLRQALGLESTFLRTQLHRVQSLHQSLMPEGLEESLGLQGMADLLDFLQSEANTR